MIDWRILLSGLPGRMAREIAVTAFDGPERGNLLPFALSSGAHHGEICEFDGGKRLELIGSEVRDLQTVADRIIAIDFSTPTAALPNAEWFCSRQIPFVMGTTGGDEIAIRDLVKQSQTCAVIAATRVVARCSNAATERGKALLELVDAVVGCALLSLVALDLLATSIV